MGAICWPRPPHPSSQPLLCLQEHTTLPWAPLASVPQPPALQRDDSEAHAHRSSGGSSEGLPVPVPGAQYLTRCYFRPFSSHSPSPSSLLLLREPTSPNISAPESWPQAWHWGSQTRTDGKCEMGTRRWASWTSHTHSWVIPTGTLGQLWAKPWAIGQC